MSRRTRQSLRRSDRAAEEPHGRGQEPDLAEDDQEQDRAAEHQQALVGRRGGTRYVDRSHVPGEVAEGQRTEDTACSSQDRRGRGWRRYVASDGAVRHGRGSSRRGLVVTRGR